MKDVPIHVLAATAVDPGEARVNIDLPHGLTVAEYVATALPQATEVDLGQARVSLTTAKGTAILPRQYWHQVRPRPGVRVVIRLIPGEDALRSVLQIVISVAAVALGGAWGATVGTALGVSTGVGTALVTLGASVVGQLLLNALIPPPQPDEVRQSYSISGWKNRLDPDGAVPMVMGTVRFAPPYATRPFTEIVGDDQYLRALFLLGEGELAITDMRIGETSLSEYDEVETEVRYGIEGELPVSLMPNQVVEEQVGVELTRPLPRDDLGEVIEDDPAIETPVVRTTGADASGASVILAFPAGLIRFTKSGRKRTHSVSVRIEHRLAQATEWQMVQELEMSAKKAEGFYRQHSWSFPSRARWQVRVTMLTDERDDSRAQQRVTWAALQTIRPEYPLAYPRPLALVAVRIKATHQLNGALDNFNVLASRICPDWDEATQSWVSRATQSPASLYRHVLQSPANPKPAADTGVDFGQIEDFAEFCTAKGLTYNRVLQDKSTTLRDILTEIAGAGRATPRHDGRQWGVVIDRPDLDALIVEHINPRNSWGFKWSRAYTDPPHAFIVTFNDAGNDFKETQRVVRWPGYDGDIELTEALPMPGKVYADEVWREARRRQLETIHRPDTYQATQDGAVRVTTRGDDVMLNHDVLSRTQAVGRVRSVTGRLVELDELVTMTEGESYAIRFRFYADAEDVIGTSVVRIVQTVPGETQLLTVQDTVDMPRAGDLVHFGPATSESYHQIVRAVEATEDMCSILHLVDAAPQIDAILDATDIPAWSSRVGDELDDNLLQPSAPRFVSVVSGLDGTDEEGLITFLIEPGAGAITTASYELDHRLQGAPSWTTASIPAANGGGSLDVYATDDVVELRLRGLSATSVAGPHSATLTLTVGAADTAIPEALDADAINVTTLLGGALIQFATGLDASTTQVQLYRSTSAVLDRETDAVAAALTVAPQQSHSLTVGDTGRTDLISGGQMDDALSWTLGAGWAIGGGVAQHTAGSADAIGQALSAEAGKYYRIALSVSGRTAGTVTPRMTGGSDRPGADVASDGTHSDRIQAVTGNDTLELLASSDFDGAVDDVTAYLETAACLTQGAHYIWLEPQNDDGVPGPLAGPFTITIT
ncbi:phage tail protein [Thalassovita sp.]|uniref:TipJ family phage tail tip protein n=1 Tax=Thalassovita sp. TaxID=1979401 RepID=UPI002881E9B0|nr:phage tail protein [Thalassovita sp.]MDF1803008.1 phage tail protein [Thalassovita sp.]